MLLSFLVMGQEKIKEIQRLKLSYNSKNYKILSAAQLNGNNNYFKFCNEFINCKSLAESNFQKIKNFNTILIEDNCFYMQ